MSDGSVFRLSNEIGFGLLAAFGWGTADFFAKLSSDRIGYLRTAVYMQIISGILLVPLAFPDLRLGVLHPVETIGAVGLGVVSTVGLLALYKGFEVGRLSIVSPIVSGYPALTSVLAIVILRETLSNAQAFGVVLTLAGVMIVSAKVRNASGEEKRKPRGLPYALLAFLAMGFLYFAMKSLVVVLGIWLPVLILRWVSTGILVSIILLGRRQLQLPDSSAIRLAGGVGVLDTLGSLAFNVGVASGNVSIVAPLSGLFSAVTVIIAAVFLRDRFAWYQWVGVPAILGGVVMIGYFR